MKEQQLACPGVKADGFPQHNVTAVALRQGSTVLNQADFAVDSVMPSWDGFYVTAPSLHHHRTITAPSLYNHSLGRVKCIEPDVA